MKIFLLVISVLCFGWAKAHAETQFFFPEKANLTVAADGSGDFRTVTEAIAKVPENNKTRFVIYIKKGVYNEQIRVPANKPFITFIGESRDETKLSFNISNKIAGTTSAAYAFYVGGHDFHAENLTFINSHQYEKDGQGQQAIAVLAEADRLIFKNCKFLGWQDTLYAKNGRQFYENCYIEGNVDFIFGQASAVFENCRIHSKGDGYVTAPMRFAADELSGFVFSNAKLTGENVEKGVYLGRPWRAFGRTVFLNSEMDAHILPAGWHNWGKAENEKTAYFAEFNSKGAGAKMAERVKWIHRLSKEEARQFETENFLKGKDGWNPRAADDKFLETNAPDWKPVVWSEVLKQKPQWYETDEAARIADQVVLFQKDNGGWEKNLDMTLMLTQSEREKLLKDKSSVQTTIDNKTTYTQVAFLAKVVSGSQRKTTPPTNFPQHKTAFFKGLDFLLSMQYENGGFPQFFPLQKNYSRRITFNDDAMIGVLKVLREIAKRKEDYLFVDEERRAKAEKAVERAIPLILKLQIEIKGVKTIWAAQYDENTLKPADARKFEPASLTAGESVSIVRFLMLDAKPNQAVADAIEAAVNWYKANKINGVRWEKVKGENVVLKDQNAPPIWARFYEFETLKPIFTGRDGVIKYDVMQIEAERRNGYAWYVSEPNELIEKDYPKWKEKIK